MQILVEVLLLFLIQPCVFDVVERLATVGAVQPLEVKKRRILSAEGAVQETMMPARGGHIEHGAGQRRKQRMPR